MNETMHDLIANEMSFEAIHQLKIPIQTARNTLNDSKSNNSQDESKSNKDMTMDGTSTCTSTSISINTRIDQGTSSTLIRPIISIGVSSDHSDSDSEESIGNVSECTNPYLERLLDRYFPSDDEDFDFGFEADGEYEYDTTIATAATATVSNGNGNDNRGGSGSRSGSGKSNLNVVGGVVTTGNSMGTSSTTTTNATAPKSPSRRKSPLRMNSSRKINNYPRYQHLQHHQRFYSKSDDHICHVVLEEEEEEEEKQHEHQQQDQQQQQHHRRQQQREYQLNNAQWMEEARRQYVVREVERQKARSRMKMKFNINDDWDSSPSTVDTAERNTREHQIENRDYLTNTPELSPEYDRGYYDSYNKGMGMSMGMGIEERGEEYMEDSVYQSRIEDDVRKSLFTPILNNNRISGVKSLKEKSELIEDKIETETDNDDDLELTYRARQIQHDLRLQEMKELAVEAERAANEGKEKFVGNATKFGVADTLSLVSPKREVKSPRKVAIHDLNWPNCGGKLPYDCETQEIYNSPPRLSTMTYRYPTPKTTDIKRPRSITSKDRLSSAPSILQNRHPSQSIVNVSSILTAKSFLSLTLTQSKFTEKKVPVLSLRHIEEVIPSFGEMHPFILSHMIRAGVKEGMLSKAGENSLVVPLEDVRTSKGQSGKETIDEKESATGSRTSSNSIFPRIHSFQKLFHSFSGLSVEDSTQNKGKVMLDSDIGIDSGSEADTYIEGCVIGTNADCTSLVSCGDSSFGEDVPLKHQSLISNEDSMSDNIVEGDEGPGNEDIMMSHSEQSDIYVCTLASEIHSPNRRPRSPPAPPPYDDIDENIKAFIQSETTTTPPNGTPTKSRWKMFLENISPARNLVAPAPRRAKSMIFNPQKDVETLVRPRLVKYHSQISLRPAVKPPLLSNPRMRDEQWLLSDSNDQCVQPKFNSVSQQNIPFIPIIDQSSTIFHSSSSTSESGVDRRNPLFTKSLNTSVTQRSSYESESGDSAFSKYLKQCKGVDSIIHKDSDTVGSSMQSIKENEKGSQISSISRNPDSATTPKPPLHPAGVRLANNLLSNAGIKNCTEVKEQVMKKSDPLFQNSSESFAVKTLEPLKNQTIDGKLDYFHFLRHDSTQRTANEILCQSTHSDSEDDRSSKGTLYPSDRSELKRENSFTSIRSCCLGEESSICSEDLSLHGVAYEEIMKHVDQPEDPSSDTLDEDKNKSMSSFLGYMENVKVPSVIERLSPLLGRKGLRKKSVYQDDEAFVGNYFYVAVGPRIEEGTCQDEPKYNHFHNTQTRFCERSQCVDPGCEDFGTSMIEHTFNLLSTKTSWDKESGPLLNEPQSYDGQPWLKKALSQCAGRRRCQRREEVIIGEKRFRAPNLQIQKGGFFSRNDEAQIHESFKVNHHSLASDLPVEDFDVNQNFLFPGIEIGPIKEDSDLHSQTIASINYIGISISEEGHNEEYRRKKYVKKMKRSSCQSLLTFSDEDEHSDN